MSDSHLGEVPPNYGESAAQTPAQHPTGLEHWVANINGHVHDTNSRLSGLEDQLTEIRNLLRAQQPEPRAAATPASPVITARAPPPHLSASTTTVAFPPRTPALKVATPPVFDGSRDKGSAFLASCKVYFALCGHQFADDHSRVLWALSFMQEGRAAQFMRRATLGAVPGLDLADWDSFEQVFKRDFCEQFEDEVARLTLEGTGYHQGSRSVEQYVDEFRELLSKAGYTDEQMLIMKFRRGLQPSLDADVAKLPPETRPLTLEGWYSRVIQIARDRQTLQLFRAAQSGSRPSPAPAAPRISAPPVAPRSPAVPLPAPSRTTPATTTLPPRAAPATSPLPPGVPMDIDRTNAARRPPTTCYRCGATGHLQRDCPRAFDVRHMSVAELQEQLEFLLAREAEAEETAGAAPEAEAQEDEEGFVERDE